MRDCLGSTVAVLIRKVAKTCNILVSFSTCQKMWSCHFAWQAWHFVTFLVSGEESLRATAVRLKLPCLWEKSQDVSFSCLDVVMSCHFAWQAWHFVTFLVSEEESVCATVLAAQLPCLYEKSQKRVTFSCLSRRVRRCGHVILRGKRGTL